MNNKDLLKMIKEKGIENCRFFVPMRPLRNTLGLIYTSSTDTEQTVECMINENQYKVEENYKITLKSTDLRYGHKHFYTSDLVSLITSGTIKFK